MNKQDYINLPTHTKLITDAGFQWIKITAKEWKCVYTPNIRTWGIGDIYTDTGGEHKEKGHTYILPFDLYLTELENGSI